ncbi:glycosyltransferase family 4 protein [Tuwongella immobilis]|uniref:Glycosyl transferase family 1 domain-containing protein n=1 Tax=Tuwongella immobilis TaxID=692036 RepID=A0A6C2YXF8_9BACT|nr:glycosyltransferase family 4 protein [Tuwongella immobilis]VIP05502.1 Glycosyltransferase OS=Singulisphaera acidiphila (strain ATCC BAA-1392 / DSM 18658 / VKM B-2454 / MOB10) GN=Sinac_2920 PE=4 SV=1: Glyco_trans_1_2 [Tuwongella immobilis]VTS08360.1 Glycosyltransferase OS=Singulisphaera acidiphila (strain ATCC BAA-1392 / DSM 18658 / VKM B-2454 / MOB10) GN=Sinac_2920 PE=4 SV=1: Glyco_trans_1_2 [Tuwongella immobilis]
MHLVALVESPEHVCCRYRLRAFMPVWDRAGHTLELRSLPRGWWDKLALGRDLVHADAVIVQRKLLHPWQISLLHRRVKRLIFDYDDAVWSRDSYSKRGFTDLRRLTRFRAMVKSSDLVIAGNRYLADQARQWVPADQVQVIPTCVQPELYPISLHRPSDTVEMVWIGSRSTLQGIERIAGMLDRLGQRLPFLRLKLICDRFLEFPNLPVIPCPWSSDTEGIELANSAIGVSWIPDDPWSRGKCGLKVLQYMAAGLPVVANPVGVHPEMIVHGETGLLAESAEEWQDAISLLANDPQLRRRMGEAGRDRLETHYSVRAGADRWLTALNRLSHERLSA